MEKLLNFSRNVLLKSRSKQTLRIMKLTVFLIFTTILNVMGTKSYSESAKLNLDMKNAPIHSVLTEIEDQSDFFFLYSSGINDFSKKVDIDADNKNINEVLNELLENTGIKYTIIDRQVFLVNKGTDSNITLQQNNITGTVRDDQGAPLPGVSVVVKGTTLGALTNESGRYSITNAPSNAILVFSFIGMTSQEIPSSGRSIIDVTLLAETVGLDEVVVIGYGTQKKSDLTGAVFSTTSKSIESQALSNVNEAFQGKIPGAVVTMASGEPGAPLQMRIRGMGTFGSTGPLYIVDGVPISVSDVNSINPNDILSANVLKDASAAAIYGSRAANGVVIITTKSGEQGATKFTYDGYYGIQTFGKFIPMLNSQQYADLNNEASDNAGKAREPAFSNPEVLKVDTDWQKEAYRNAPVINHSLNISGGSQNAKYSVSGGYFFQEGIMVYNFLERYTLRSNSQFNLGKKITVGQTINLSRSSSLNQGQGNNLDFTYLLGASPTMRVHRETNLGGWAGPNTAETGRNNRENIVARRAMRPNRGNQNRVLANIWGEYNIIPSLKYRLNLGLNYGGNKTKLYVPIYEAENRSVTRQSLSQSTSENWEYLMEHTLTFNKVLFENINVNLLAGFTQQSANGWNMSGSIQDFPSNDLQVISAGTGTYSLSGNESAYALRSYLGRANITFFDKYLFTTTFRRDGSSRFGKNNRYGNFPSFAVGWNIDRENFMDNISFIDRLKLRASWGQLGNQEIGNYANQSTINTKIRYILGTNQAVAPAATITSLGNPDLKWETTTQTNIGIDLTTLKDRLSFTADFWVKNSDGVLLRMPITAASGIDRNNGPYQNSSAIKNSGFEFSLGYKQQINKLDFEVSANLSTVKNRITSLGGLPYVISLVNNSYNYGVFTYTAVGESMSSYYGYVMEGIFQNSEEVTNHAAQTGAAPGDVKFKDLNNDKVITAEDRTVIGDPWGDFEYGFSASARYRGFDLGMSFRGSQGYQLYNSQRAFLESMDGEHGQMATTLNRWNGEGSSYTMPRAVRGEPNQNARPSTRFVEDASFLKCQSLQIGYSFPGSMFGNIGVSNLRVYLNMQNLFTLTKYPNYNPDILGGSGGSNVNSMNPLSIGVDTGTYPIPSIFQFGVSIGF